MRRTEAREAFTWLLVETRTARARISKSREGNWKSLRRSRQLEDKLVNQESLSKEDGSGSLEK